MSILQSLIKVSAPITNDEDLNKFIKNIRAQRNTEAITNAFVPGSSLLNSLVINPETNRMLEGAGLGAAGQTTGQNFLGNLGTYGAMFGGGALGAGVGAGLGALAGRYSRALADGIPTGPKGAILPLGVLLGSQLGVLPGAIGGLAASENNRANRLEKRVRAAYAAKTSSPITNDAELEDFIRTAKKQRNQQTLHGILNPISAITNPLMLNPELNRTLEGAGLGAAGQTAGQNFLGTQGSQLAGVLGATAGGLGLAMLGRRISQLPRFAGKGIGKIIPLSPLEYTTPATIAGALGGALGGGYGAFGASEKIRSNRLERRIRDAYAANQLAG